MKRILIAAGDPNKINTWSGTPYYFLKAGKRLGFIDSAIPLNPEKLIFSRLFWNFITWIKTGEKGGFQYSPSFRNKLLGGVTLKFYGDEIISFFPLLPSWPWDKDFKVNYYIDATLKQNFEDYGVKKIIASNVYLSALAQERQNYNSAQLIVCMSEWARKSVINDYNISPDKVYVINPGANIDEEKISNTTLSDFAGIQKLRLGFIGRDWQRKGLSFLLKVAQNLNTRGIPVEVVAIGPDIHKAPRHPLLRNFGFLDKYNKTAEFIEVVRSFHFGCLFSTAETFGISSLECLRLGVPVLASSVGGIKESIPEGLGFVFDPDVEIEKVADLLESYFKSPGEYNKLRNRVLESAPAFSWSNAVDKFIKLWQK